MPGTVPTPPVHKHGIKQYSSTATKNTLACTSSAGESLASLSSMSFATSRALPLTAWRGLLEARLKGEGETARAACDSESYQLQLQQCNEHLHKSICVVKYE